MADEGPTGEPGAIVNQAYELREWPGLRGLREAH
jgi:hypothetical protein